MGGEEFHRERIRTELESRSQRVRRRADSTAVDDGEEQGHCGADSRYQGERRWRRVSHLDVGDARLANATCVPPPPPAPPSAPASLTRSVALSSSASLGSLRQRTSSFSGNITPVYSAFPFTRNTYRIPPTILISPSYPALFPRSICIRAVSCPLFCGISYTSFARLRFRTLGEHISVTGAPLRLA